MGQIRDFPLLPVKPVSRPVAADAYALVVPALDPPDGLPAYLVSLRERCHVPIVLVDDGSSSSCAGIFRACAAIPGVSVLRHGTNRGKGRALKTAFSRLLETCPGLRGCVTCDCDGQHAPDDVARCLDALAARPDALVLGCRVFSLAQVPWKSRLGNNAMRLLFRLVTGRPFLDTQTGLRAIPVAFMQELLDCPGERFEFETRMLLRMGTRKLEEVPIRTLYVDGNRGTHFNPVADSLRIVSLVLSENAGRVARFALASLLSSGVDIGLFALLYHRMVPAGAPARLLSSVVAARMVSLTFNYACNRYLVFADARADRRFDRRAFGQYLLLAVAVMGVSYGGTRLVHAFLPAVSVTAVKAVVDFCLFLATYAIQRIFIFRSASE